MVAPFPISRKSKKSLRPPKDTIVDKFSRLPKHAGRFELLRQKKEQAEADHKREYEEKRAAAAAKQKAKEEREAALAGEAAAAASTTGTIGKFKAPKNIPVSCPAVPVQKNQVCVFFKHVECAAMAYNPSAL